MANARWKCWRETAHLRPESEPKMIRSYPLEFGVRNKATGEIAWTDLKSVRDATRRLNIILKFY